MSEYPGRIRIIGGQFRGRKIPVLSVKALRPTPDRVRETLFNWLQGTIHNARCIDFFSGTGILGFEALSRGASSVLMLDADQSIVHLLKKTRDVLNLTAEQCEILHRDARDWIKTASADKPYDLIFLDPPFDSTLLEECIALLASSPLLGERSHLYLELPVGKILPTLEGFEVFKTKEAGKVSYVLLKKITHG